MAFLDDFPASFQRHSGENRRFGFRRLFQNGWRNGVPCQTDPDEGSPGGFRKNGIFFRPFPQRNARSAFNLITAVGPRHSRPVRFLSIQIQQQDFRGFVGCFPVQPDARMEIILPVADSVDEVIEDVHSAHDRENGMRAVFDAEERQVAGGAYIFRIGARMKAHESGGTVAFRHRRNEKVTVGSGCCAKIIQMDFQRFRILRYSVYGNSEKITVHFHGNFPAGPVHHRCKCLSHDSLLVCLKQYIIETRGMQSLKSQKNIVYSSTFYRLSVEAMQIILFERKNFSAARLKNGGAVIYFSPAAERRLYGDTAYSPVDSAQAGFFRASACFGGDVRGFPDTSSLIPGEGYSVLPSSFLPDETD